MWLLVLETKCLRVFLSLEMRLFHRCCGASEEKVDWAIPANQWNSVCLRELVAQWRCGPRCSGNNPGFNSVISYKDTGPVGHCGDIVQYGRPPNGPKN